MASSWGPGVYDGNVGAFCILSTAMSLTFSSPSAGIYRRHDGSSPSRIKSIATRRRSSPAPLRPMRGLKTDRTATFVIREQAHIWNLLRGHYELGTEVAPVLWLATAFDERQLPI